MTLAETLALTNACLNATSAVCVGIAYRAIRAHNILRHRRFMLLGFAASCVFLVSYLTRITLFGDTRFRGEGIFRTFYFTLLISHIALAVVVVPLVLRTLWLGLKRRDTTHRRIARVTFPIWIYVSVTGVLVYLMLYHFPGQEHRLSSGATTLDARLSTIDGRSSNMQISRWLPTKRIHKR